MTSQSDRAAAFRELHSRRPLVLPNAWDAASARLVELAGAPAIATSSAGIAWSLGRPDGQELRRDEMIRTVEYIVSTVALPVSADVESGYGTGSVGDIVETVRAVIEAGAVGVNLEDSPGSAGNPLLAAESHAERIAAARDAARSNGIDLFINARTDVYLLQVGAPEARFDEVLRRAEIYRAAGADCLFVPGVIAAETIAALARSIGYPLNVLAAPRAPSIGELGSLGVARVSVGAGLARVALAATRQAARELLEEGSYRAFEAGSALGDVNAIFRRGGSADRDAGPERV